MTKSISMTDFMEVVVKSGSPKATKVKQIKERKPYDVVGDFYKALREGIIELHKKKKDKKELNALIAGLADPKKSAGYTANVKGYQKWLGKKNVAMMKETRTNYTHAGFSVTVNPEICAKINGVPHVIKLYFKEEALTKSKVNVSCALMEMTMRPQLSDDIVIGILDVRNAKLHTFSGDIKLMGAVVNGELSYIASVWDTV